MVHIHALLACFSSIFMSYKIHTTDGASTFAPSTTYGQGHTKIADKVD